MFDPTEWQPSGQQSWRSNTETQKSVTIHDIDRDRIELLPVFRFLVSFGLGVFFFLIPVTWQGQVTVPFDIVASYITDNYTLFSELVALLLITYGGLLTTIAEFRSWGVLSIGNDLADRINLPYWKTSPVFWVFRVIGALFALILFFELGPDVLHAESTGGLIWGTVALSVAIIIPLGAIFVNLLIELGGLEFIGTLSRPIMRPLFKLPGRAALDSVASWIGAFTVGYYVTYNVFNRGGYNKREVFIIATCFAPVSIGFLGVIVSTAGLLSIFPVILLAWIVSIILCGIIVVRVPPLKNVPNEYIVEPDPEPAFTGSVFDYFRFAISEAMHEATFGRIVPSAVTGLIDGLKIVANILGTVVAIGMITILLINQTDIFEIIALPLTPVISALAIPDPSMVASAILISGVEQVTATAIVAEADVMARFFVVIMCASQIIFFAASGPMMMDMFDNVPIRFRDLIVLFCLRTVVLIPIVAALTHVVNWLGILP